MGWDETSRSGGTGGGRVPRGCSKAVILFHTPARSGSGPRGQGGWFRGCFGKGPARPPGGAPSPPRAPAVVPPPTRPKPFGQACDSAAAEAGGGFRLGPGPGPRDRLSPPFLSLPLHLLPGELGPQPPSPGGSPHRQENSQHGTQRRRRNGGAEKLIGDGRAAAPCLPAAPQNNPPPLSPPAARPRRRGRLLLCAPVECFRRVKTGGDGRAGGQRSGEKPGPRAGTPPLRHP